MIRKKHPHQILACFFAALTLFSTVFLIDKAFNSFPLSFNFTSTIFTIFAIAIVSGFLFLGILLRKKFLIIASAAILIIYKIIISVLSGIMALFANFPFFSFSSYSINHIVNINGILTIVTLVFLFLYTLNLLKNKKLVYTFTIITWFLSLTECIFAEFNPLIFFFSAYILLLHYVDINNLDTPIKTGEVFFLSIVTFGIYYVLWNIFLIKKVALITEGAASFSEVLFFIIFPPYSAFWFYTRYEDLNYFVPVIKNRGTICMVLSIFLLNPLSLSILQRDFNTLAQKSEFIPDSENE